METKSRDQSQDLPSDFRHQCMVYEGSPAEHLPGLATLVAKKLQSSHRVLYLNSPAMVAGLRSYIVALGIDVVGEIERGALVLSSSDSHLVNGSFAPKRMLSQIEEALAEALQDGYVGLWAAGDMTWEFGAERDYSKLCEYELGLEELFLLRPELQGICQYHMDTLPPSVTLEAFGLHRACFINETLSRINPHYNATDYQEGRADRDQSSKSRSSSQKLQDLPVIGFEYLLAEARKTKG